jgi:hypothetical protein
LLPNMFSQLVSLKLNFFEFTSAIPALKNN